MHQSIRQLPLSSSSKASLARKSSFPAATSSSICLSHCCSSKSKTQSVSWVNSCGESLRIADSICSTAVDIV
jgi:hypothetical protein